MNSPRDTPRRIAQILFILGIGWAVFLILPVVVAIFGSLNTGLDPRAFLLILHFLCSYAVWFGWFWRSRRLRALSGSSLLWAASFAVNAAFIILLVPDGPQWRQQLFRDPGIVIVLWWSAVSVLSLVALVFEFRLHRDEKHVV